MIKINLCPIDELQSPFWYVPDVVAAVVIAVAAYFGMQYYLGTIQDEIATVASEGQSLAENTSKLQPDLIRFKNLGADIDTLNGKLQALQSITVSKIAKYKPVIVLEHFQNLKPEGLWFDTLKIGVKEGGREGGGAPGEQAQAQDSDLFEIKGQALDSILTAEFMTAVRSTASQERDAADLRTQVYFADLTLVDVQLPKGGNRAFPELSTFPEFAIKGHFKERGGSAAIGPNPAAAPAAPAAPSDPVLAPAAGLGPLKSRQSTSM